MQDGGRSIWPYFQRGACVIALSALAACASRMDGAPVVDRTGGMAPSMSTNPSDQPPGPPPPGYYRVQPGDTLYRVALQNGQNYRDIATWNNLNNPNQIEVGQLLRVAPPGANLSGTPGGVATAPLGNAGVQTSTLGGPAPGAPTGASAYPSPYAAPSGGAAPGSTPPSPYPSPYASDSTTGATNGATNSATNGGMTGGTGAPGAATPYAPPVVPTPAITPTSPAPAPDAAGSSAPSGPVSFMWPVKGPILHTFNGASYKGIDIGGAPGTPILAAAAGRVLYAGSGLRSYGKLIIIKHNNTFLTAYAHNQSLLVHEGDAVTKGQKIAEMGDTEASQVMLHFEVRKDTKPVDPLKFLPSQ